MTGSDTKLLHSLICAVSTISCIETKLDPIPLATGDAYVMGECCPMDERESDCVNTGLLEAKSSDSQRLSPGICVGKPGLSKSPWHVVQRDDVLLEFHQRRLGSP